MKLVTLNPPPFLRFHQGSGQSVVLQYDEKDEESVFNWIKSCFLNFEDKVEIKTSPQPQPQAPSYVNVPQTKEVLDAEEDFKPALCLSCEKQPIAHLSGLCNACDKTAKETLASLPETESNTSENKEENDNV